MVKRSSSQLRAGRRPAFRQEDFHALVGVGQRIKRERKTRRSNCGPGAPVARSGRMQQRPRNPYSSAEIDRSSHERENEERMIELASSGAARFVPIDSEKNLVKTGGNPEAVFLQGMMARAVANSADHHIFLGYVDGTPCFASIFTGKETPLAELGEFVDLRQV